VATRMSKLEQETGKLRQKLTEKEHVIHSLQERVAEAEATLEETNARFSQSMEEQVGDLKVFGNQFFPFFCSFS